MTIYYLDHGAKEGQLTGTLTFTNGSTTVTGSGTSFTSELSVGDYIISDDSTNGLEWYKVTAIASDTELTIDHAFNQATHSSTASYNKQSNVTGGGTAAAYDSASGVGPFCHLQQFMDVAAAGDVCYVRANQTYYHSATINPIADATYSSPIRVIGDDGTQFGDTFTSKATFDFQGYSGGAGIKNYLDRYYEYENIAFKNIANDAIYALGSVLIKVKNCDFISCKNGLNINSNNSFEVSGCLFDSCTNRGVNLAGGGSHLFDGCTFQNNNIAIYAGGSSRSKLIGCTFSNNTDDLIVDSTQGTMCEVVVLGGTEPAVAFNLDSSGDYYASQGVVKISGSVEKTITKNWVAERDTTTVTGNAASSIKVTPRANRRDVIRKPVFEWVIDGVTGGVQHTISVDVRGSGWTTLPTSDELWIEVEYVSDANTLDRAVQKSTSALSANDVWTSFSVSFTPATDGYVVVRGYLEKYESTGVVWFNGEVTIT
ncbi:right-handed parallel beta-helix repeat-containing protein [Geoglobus ahangari]